MDASALSPMPSDRAAISPLLLKACLALFVVNAAFFMVMSVSDQWVVDAQGLGIPTDFINVWSAGWLVLQTSPSLQRHQCRFLQKRVGKQQVVDR